MLCYSRIRLNKRLVLHYLRPGQPLVPVLVLWLYPGFSLCLPLPQLGVVFQDTRVGFQHMVECMEAVGTAHLAALAQWRPLWEVNVPVRAHEGEQLLLQCADLLWHPFQVGGLVKGCPVGIQDFVEYKGACASLLANRAKLLQGRGAEKGAQLWPLCVGGQSQY